MFELYTETARRCIFFARYEASLFGSRFIEPEHLLLGILRDDKRLVAMLRIASVEALRRKIEERLGPVKEKIATSADLPLSESCKQMLAYAAEESEKLGHKNIGTDHLVLGLLREKSGASELLSEIGIDYGSALEILGKIPAEPDQDLESEIPESAAGALAQPLVRLSLLIGGAAPYLKNFSNLDGAAKLRRKDWTRCQAIGHLIDWTTAHHLWIARALTEPKVTSAGYPLEEWVAAQHYDQLRFRRLVLVWLGQCRLLMHVIAQIPEEKLGTPIRIGIEEPMTLLRVIEKYVEHCEDLVAQILVKA